MTEVLNVLVQNEYNTENAVPAGIGDGGPHIVFSLVIYVSI